MPGVRIILSTRCTYFFFLLQILKSTTMTTTFDKITTIPQSPRDTRVLGLGQLRISWLR